jgi:pyruvate/2-oxoglutarate dehydrogenase complex dihydrolipoamide acyltransferase (E2) component
MPRHDIILPELGISGQPIVASLWLVERGATVIRGDAVLEILCGAATVDLPAPASGVLVAKLVEEDEPIAVGQRLGVIEEIAD